jgi:hypothetical protein
LEVYFFTEKLDLDISAVMTVMTVIDFTVMTVMTVPPNKSGGYGALVKHHGSNAEAAWREDSAPVGEAVAAAGCVV